MISLIIPAYNEEKTIREVIIKSKKYVDEIIVADNNSNDKTKEIAKEENVKIIITKEKGYEKNIQNAINNSKGDIITIDADMEHDPNDIPLFIEKKDYDVIIGKRKLIPRKGEIELSEITKRFNVEDPLCGFKFIKRKVLEKYDFFYNENYGLDFLFKIKNEFKIGNIEIKEMPRRKDPRVGNETEIENKLRKMKEYLLEKFLN